MTLTNAIQKRGIKWLLGFGFWTLIGLSFAFQFYISSAKAGLDVSWKQAVGYALGDWYVFALLSIPVIWRADLILKPATGHEVSRCIFPPVWCSPSPIWFCVPLSGGGKAKPVSPKPSNRYWSRRGISICSFTGS